MNLPPVGSGVHLHLHVLLVEDVPMIAKLVERMLMNSPHCTYRCEWKSTLADALEALREQDFDTVLLDLNLPDSADLPTLARVLETVRNVPVVVLTATDDDTVGIRAVQAGAQDYLVKGECSGPALDRSIVYSIERHRLQQALRQLAVLDELTGLYNRRGFTTLNPDVLAQVRAGEARGYLACFDLDRFKAINDVHGHACGDRALVEFATHLRSAFRKEGLFGRMGGDEFVAMGVEPRPGFATEALAHLQELLAARNAGTALFPLHSSAGLVLFDNMDTRSVDEMLAEADAALYRHKQARRAARETVPPDAAPEDDR